MKTVYDYPYDTKMLLRKKRALKKELLQQENLLTKRIAILGGSTTNEVADQLEIALLCQGIKPEIYQSEYAQYWQDAMFGNSELDEFNPDVIYIHTSWRNINRFPDATTSEAEACQMLEEQTFYFSQMWDKLSEKFHCPIIQNNFERPNWRLLGNRDISDYRGRSNFLSRLNQKLYEYANTHNNFYINDLEFLAMDYGISAWNDAGVWNMYKYAMAIDAIPSVAKSVANIVKAIYGKNKKVLVCDLDNTLWGGIVGDDGVEGIAVGPEIPEGQAYGEFQSYIKSLKALGVLLAINSKNDKENAIAGLKHPSSELSPEDFIVIQANWNPKDMNMVEIAQQLNLGIDSLVFIDDNPAEREIVKKQLPMVETPVMDSVENYIKTLDHAGYFETISLSEDDLKRNEMYKANAERVQLQMSFNNYDEYLDSLEMVATIANFEPIYISRIAQLTNKSNQFNLTTLRCSESDIKNMADSEDYICLYGKLEDKFGDNGVVSVVVGKIENDSLNIILWLMSCRVLKRGMEDAMMNSLIKECKNRGIEKMIGNYYPTAKNSMVKEFYEGMGLELVSTDEIQNKRYVAKVSDMTEKNIHIKIK